MTDLDRQVECELRMYHGGIKRATNMIERAETAGRAHQNPYAKVLYRAFVLPLSEFIRADVEAAKAGRAGQQASDVMLLAPLDPEAVAFLAVRTAMNTILGPKPDSHRVLAYSLGRTVHRELVLAQIETINPDLYHTLARDFGRRRSTDERHRLTVYMMQAKKAGIVWEDWGVGARDKVGMYLLGALERIGMVDIGPIMTKGYKQVPRSVTLQDDAQRAVSHIRTHTAETMPTYGPCLIPPKDWTNNLDGGFHTPELRRQHHDLVKCSPTARPRVRAHDMPIVRAAVNALQRTAWKINTPILDVVYKLAENGIELKAQGQPIPEIPVDNQSKRPARPDWFDTVEKDNMTPAQADDLRAWKKRMSEWYTERKLSANLFGRFHAATRAAEMFRNEAALYFVYFADSRGRLYPMTHGVNPQGSDLQKALLHFAKGLPVDTPEAIMWFHVQGANKWGFDKATLKDRQQWVVDRQDQILAMAAAPLDNLDWLQAGDPLQFLAWAMEYRAWVEDTSGAFVSHLPISMDGSCNGLQNFSAMLRDEVGGRATNLTANEVMEDIYRRVAEAATARMARLPDDAKRIRSRWLAHGIARAVVKRSVMTTPYGVTRRSAEDYVITDYLAKGEAPCFKPEEYREAARLLMECAWPAIGDVVVKSREAMDWLRKVVRAVVAQRIKDGDPDPVVDWVTPSGFLATQGYFEAEIHRITTRLHGVERIRVLTETDDPDVSQHASGMAPNFVHSMDASHLALCTVAAAEAGITDLAMIHDDYGTHAANAGTLYRLIRETFHRMYTDHDPIQDLFDRYPGLPKPPTKGNLDLDEVLASQFFFS